MSNKDLFIERRHQGDFAVRRAYSERASTVESTQAKAIAEARRLEPKATVLVERVRHTNVGKPDKWRRP
jgi:pyridoxine/pyridoxamine 5'-phosphate oxidase